MISSPDEIVLDPLVSVVLVVDGLDLVDVVAVLLGGAVLVHDLQGLDHEDLLGLSHALRPVV